MKNVISTINVTPRNYYNSSKLPVGAVHRIKSNPPRELLTMEQTEATPTGLINLKPGNVIYFVSNKTEVK